MWKPRTSLRICLAAFGFISAVFLPWWVTVIAIILLALFWRAGEVMLIGLLMDLLWSPLHSMPWFTIGAIVAVWLLEPLRKEFLAG